MLSAKQYSCSRYKKTIKSTSRLSKHFNTYIKEIPQTVYLHKLYNNPVDTSDGNLEDGSQLLNETNYIVRDAIDLPTKRIPWDELLISKSLSLLKEE